MIAVLELLYVVGHVRQFGVLGDGLVIIVLHAEGDVALDSVREQEVVLGHIGTAVPEGADGDVIHVLAVDKQRAVGHVIGAEDKVNESSLARASLAHKAHVLSGLYLEADVLQRVVLTVGIAEGKVPKLNATLDTLYGLCPGPVHHGRGRVQKLADPVHAGLAPGGHVDKLAHGHDGPYHRVKVADKLHQLPGVEYAGINQISAVTQNNADHALNKEGDENPKEHGYFGVVDVGHLVFLIEVLEGQELLGLLHEGLNDGYAGKALLREVGKL